MSPFLQVKSFSTPADVIPEHWLDRPAYEAHGRIVPYKSALLVLMLAIVPLLYVNAWLSLAAAIAAYAIVAKLANRQFDRASLIRSLRSRPVLPKD